MGLWSCDETGEDGDDAGDGGAEVAEDGAGGDLGETDGVGEDLVGDPAGDVPDDDVDDAATGDVAADLTDADVTTEVDTAVDIAGDIEDAAVDAIDDADGTGDAVSDSAFEEMWADFGVDASSDWDAYPLPDFCPEPWWSWNEWTTPCLAEDPDTCTAEDHHFNRHTLCMARSSSDVVTGTVLGVDEYECFPGDPHARMCLRYRVQVDESLRGLSGEVVVGSTTLATSGVCLEVRDRAVMYLRLGSSGTSYSLEHQAGGYFPIGEDGVCSTSDCSETALPEAQYLSELGERLETFDPQLCRCVRNETHPHYNLSTCR